MDNLNTTINVLSGPLATPPTPPLPNLFPQIPPPNPQIESLKGRVTDSPVPLEERVTTLQSAATQHGYRYHRFSSGVFRYDYVALVTQPTLVPEWFPNQPGRCEPLDGLFTTPDLDTPPGNKNFKSYDTLKREGWALERVLGRSLVFTHPKREERLIWKCQKVRENPEEFFGQFFAAQALNRHAELGLGTQHPTPLGCSYTYDSEYISICVDNPQWKESLDFHFFTSSEKRGAYQYLAPKGYEIYLNELSGNEFWSTLRLNLGDHLSLLMRGLVYDAPIELWHGERTYGGQSDNVRETGEGLYLNYYRLFRNSDEAQGRLLNWRESLYFSDFRATGFADERDCRFFEDLLDGKNLQITESRLFKGGDKEKIRRVILSEMIARLFFLADLFAADHAFRVCRADSSKITAINIETGSELLETYAHLFAIAAGVPLEQARALVASQTTPENAGGQIIHRCGTICFHEGKPAVELGRAIPFPEDQTTAVRDLLVALSGLIRR